MIPGSTTLSDNMSLNIKQVPNRQPSEIVCSDNESDARFVSPCKSDARLPYISVKSNHNNQKTYSVSSGVATCNRIMETGQATDWANRSPERL